MRVFVGALIWIGNADGVEQFDRTSACDAATREVGRGQRLFNLKANRVERIERDHRLLEHEPDAAPAYAAHLRVAQLEKIASAELDLPGNDTAGRRHEPDDRQRC